MRHSLRTTIVTAALVLGAGPSLAELEGAILRASDGAGTPALGTAVAVDGALMAVGADFAEIDGNSSQGAAYLFEESVPCHRVEKDEIRWFPVVAGKEEVVFDCE